MPHAIENLFAILFEALRSRIGRSAQLTDFIMVLCSCCPLRVISREAQIAIRFALPVRRTRSKDAFRLSWAMPERRSEQRGVVARVLNRPGLLPN